jgi:hypothetical protein
MKERKKERKRNVGPEGRLHYHWEGRGEEGRGVFNDEVLCGLLLCKH